MVGNTIRVTRPSRSRPLKVRVSMRWEIPPTMRLISLNRLGPPPSSMTISTLHLSPTRGRRDGSRGRSSVEFDGSPRRRYGPPSREDPMSTAYETDVVAWSKEQAALLRAGRLSALDIEHIADEVEDVGKSEQRELASRMALLLVHLLKWRHQPERRGKSWEFTVREQRRAIVLHLEDVPSLRVTLGNPRWFAAVWSDALAKAAEETGLTSFPETCPWSQAEILDPDFLPG